jgi:hypothetical protein
MKGTVVRTLVDEPRPSGTYADKWDGKGDGGKRLKDDQYRWVATFSDGSHTFTIDRSNEFDGDFELKSHPTTLRGIPSGASLSDSATTLRGPGRSFSSSPAPRSMSRLRL